MSSETGSPAAAQPVGTNGHANGSTNGHVRKTETRESVTIRFAGDSGDGMQLAGTQFTNTSALLGNDITTFPDFPAEIRAPAGTLAGVSGFQVHFSSTDIHTPGDDARHARRDEPGRPEDEPQGPAAGRHPDRQHRRVRRPAT